MATKFKAAAQLYTVRGFMKTPDEIAKGMKRIKDMGYNIVQISGLGAIDPNELNDIVKQNGIEVCVTHTPYDRIINNTDDVIKDHKLWGCNYIGLGSISGGNSEESVKKLISEMKDVVVKFKENGMNFTFHNHQGEFERFDSIGGITLLDYLFNNLDCHMTLDLYWVQVGGASPSAYIKKYAGRCDVVHFKDMIIKSGKSIMAPVGEGNLDWDAIIEACEVSGVKYACVEDDSAEEYGDPFSSLELSLKNMIKMGISL